MGLFEKFGLVEREEAPAVPEYVPEPAPDTSVEANVQSTENIIGEIYTAMDAFSNLEVEQKLADMGVEVHRWMNVTNSMLRPGIRNHQIAVRDRSEYSMGANSTTDIWQAQTFAEKGFDGLIHIKSANCTPEVDIMPVLANLSQDFKIPVLYLTYDSQSSDVGLMTRLEAFYDMIEIRKKVAA